MTLAVVKKDSHAHTKRLFFGVEINAKWPNLPHGRLLAESDRHLTLAFLGNVEWDPLRRSLDSIPLPSFKVGLTGIFDRCLLLPESAAHPRVAAWHATFYRPALLDYQKRLAAWLREHHYLLDSRPFLAHVTLARAPFDSTAWQNSFQVIPFSTGAIHLYESQGNLSYKPIWSYTIAPPITEISHTADIAFTLCSETVEELHRNAAVALCMQAPEMLPYLSRIIFKSSLDDIIIDLNSWIGTIDREIGSPYKAISFHGAIRTDQDGLLYWDMIVDV